MIAFNQIATISLLYLAAATAWCPRIRIPSPGSRSIIIIQQSAKPTATADLSNRRKRRDRGLNDSVSQRLMVPLAVVMNGKFFHGPSQ
jgi:hypothetical protein